VLKNNPTFGDIYESMRLFKQQKHMSTKYKYVDNNAQRTFV